MPRERAFKSMIPWIGGVSNFGHLTTRPAEGLQVAKNIIYDYDGTKHRRGGQAHIHLVPVSEGLSLEDHFLGPSIRESWTQSLGDVVFDLSRESILRGYGDSVAPGTSSITRTMDSVLTLVTSLSSDLATAETETELFSITARVLTTDLGDGTTDGFFEIEVDPGQPGGGGAEWLFSLRFTPAGIQLFDGVTYTDLASISGAVNELSTATTTFIDTENYHNWRFDLTRPGAADYRLAVYIDEEVIYSNLSVPIASTTSAYTKLEWQNGNTGGTVFPVDVSIDRIDVDAEAKKIRGLAPFRAPSDSPVTRVAVSAGSRIFLEEGHYYNIRCIDEGLPLDRAVDFKTFKNRLIYVSFLGDRPRRFTLGDRKGSIIDGAPRCSMLQTGFANRLWAAGDPSARSRLYFSGFLDETIWTTEFEGDFSDSGFLDIQPDDGEGITAIGPPYRGVLPVYKERSIHLVRGFSPDNFTRENVSKTIGAVSHFAVVNVLNDQYFVSEVGVHSLATTDKFGDVEYGFLTRDIRRIWKDVVNTSQLHMATAINNEPFDRFEILVPAFLDGEDGITPALHLSLQYGVTTEAFPTGIWSWKLVTGYSQAMALRVGDIRTRHLVGSGDGYINKQDENYRFDFPVFAL